MSLHVLTKLQRLFGCSVVQFTSKYYPSAELNSAVSQK
jgi:hypothetical protein